MLDILDKGGCNAVEIKKTLNNYINSEVTINYNLGRNKYERYKAIIIKLYDNTFIVKTQNQLIKSFSYSDIITKTIKIN